MKNPKTLIALGMSAFCFSLPSQAQNLINYTAAMQAYQNSVQNGANAATTANTNTTPPPAPAPVTAAAPTNGAPMELSPTTPTTQSFYELQKKLDEVNQKLADLSTNTNAAPIAGNTGTPVNTSAPPATTSVGTSTSSTTEDHSNDVAIQQEPKDLTAAGLSVEFSNDGMAHLTGPSLPETCLNRIQLFEVKDFDPASSDALTSESDLKDASKRFGFRVIFLADTDKSKSLKECIQNHSKDRKLPLNGKFSVALGIDSDTTPAVGDFMGTDNEIVFSNNFAKNGAYLAAKKYSCADCTTPLDAIAGLSGLDLPDVSKLILDKANKAYDEISEKIETTDSLKGLRELSDSAMALASEVSRSKAEKSSKEEFAANVHNMIVKGINARAIDISIGKDNKAVTQAADFVRDSYKGFRSLKNLDEDTRNEDKYLAKGFAKGGEERLAAIAAMDPLHPEVEEGLAVAEQNILKHRNDYYSKCYNANGYNFEECSRAQSEYSDYVAKIQPVKQRHLSLNAQFSSMYPGQNGMPMTQANRVAMPYHCLAQQQQLQQQQQNPFALDPRLFNNGMPAQTCIPYQSAFAQPQIWNGQQQFMQYPQGQTAQNFQNQFVGNQTLDLNQNSGQNPTQNTGANGFVQATPIPGVSPNAGGTLASNINVGNSPYGYQNSGYYLGQPTQVNPMLNQFYTPMQNYQGYYQPQQRGSNAYLNLNLSGYRI